MRILFFLSCLSGFVCHSQSPAFVNETCEALNGRDQLEVIFERTLEHFGYFVDADSARKGVIQKLYRFQYKLRRELIRTCPAFQLGEFKVKTQAVLDLDSLLSDNEVDSLKERISVIREKHKLDVLIVTVDDFYPATTITDFSDEKLTAWGKGQYVEKGGLIIVVSVKKREIRTATDETSLQFITETECTEINQVIIPELKKGNVYEGLKAGLAYLAGKI